MREAKDMSRGKKPVDLTGKRFGRFIALCPTDERDKKNSVVWQCRCDCGKEFRRAAQRIVHGSISCGCRHKSNPGQFQSLNISGKSTRDIEFLYPTERRTKGGYVYWQCRCNLCDRKLVKRSQSFTEETASCRCR